MLVGTQIEFATTDAVADVRAIADPEEVYLGLATADTVTRS